MSRRRDAFQHYMHWKIKQLSREAALYKHRYIRLHSSVADAIRSLDITTPMDVPVRDMLRIANAQRALINTYYEKNAPPGDEYYIDSSDADDA